jgi:hypothetical protein
MYVCIVFYIHYSTLRRLTDLQQVHVPPHAIKHVYICWPATGEELLFLVEDLPVLQILEATNSSPISIADTKSILQIDHQLRQIDVKPEGDDGDWAELIEVALVIVKFQFGHQVIDSVPRRMLKRDRADYSRPIY